MKFTINQDLFSEVLQKHIPVIPARTTLPILNSIKWDLADGKLKMHSTDLEITLVTDTEVDMEEAGSVAVPARKLSEIVRELPKEPISVSVEENFRIKIQGLTGFYHLAGSDPDDFPAVPGDNLQQRFSVTGKCFKRMVEKTAFAVSRDDMRPTLCGIFLQATAADIRAVSTDGHRLSKLVDTSYKGSEKTYEAIVPVKALNLAARNMRDDADIKVFSSGNYLMLELDGDFLYTRLIEGKYPQYENVIPKSNSILLTANVEALNASVRRVAIFSNSLSRQVRFALSENQILVTAEDNETGGEAEERLSVDYQGGEMLIGYNANYVLEAMRQVDAEDVKFSIGTPDSACIIEPLSQDADYDFMMLLMPVRLT